jgi:hypothetical protein
MRQLSSSLTLFQKFIMPTGFGLLLACSVYYSDEPKDWGLAMILAVGTVLSLRFGFRLRDVVLDQDRFLIRTSLKETEVPVAHLKSIDVETSSRWPCAKLHFSPATKCGEEVVILLPILVSHKDETIRLLRDIVAKKKGASSENLHKF